MVVANNNPHKIRMNMKKIFLTMVGALLLAGGVSAQSWTENNWAVRAGFNIANVNIDNLSTDSKFGVHVAGVYERALFDTTPLYLETGLAFTQKGYKCEMGATSHKANLWYMEIPIGLNYKFALDHEWTIYPSAGFYYALGIGGKIKYEGDTNYKVDAFGGESDLKRSDMGLRIGCTVDYNRYQAAIGYSIGLLDYAGKSSPEVKNRTLFISVGYRF